MLPLQVESGPLWDCWGQCGATWWGWGAGAPPEGQLCLLRVRYTFWAPGVCRDMQTAGKLKMKEKHKTLMLTMLLLL